MKRFISNPVSLSAIAFLGIAVFTELSSFSVASYGLTAGSTTSATATLISLSRSPVPVIAFKSSNPSVAQVPLSKLASTGTVVIDVTAVAPGCAQITASYGGRARTDDVVVHPASTTTAFTMKVPDQVLPYPGLSDGTLTRTLTFTSPDRTTAPGTITVIPTYWKLSSSNTSIVTVPDSVKVSTSATFKIAGRGEGCATITARLGTASVSKTVMTRYIGG
jgi:hypothetical protein